MYWIKNNPKSEHFSQTVPDELLCLWWTDIDSVAAYFERLSKALRKAARTKEAAQETLKKSRQYVDTLEATHKIVLRFLSQGYNSLESAISATARETGFPETTIRGWWALYIKKRDQASRDDRDALIIRLVQSGLTNIAIAQRLTIHPNTVSRAITKHLHGNLRPVDRARLRKRRRKSE